MKKPLDEAVELLTQLRVEAVKKQDDELEKKLYDVEQLIFEHRDHASISLPTDEILEKVKSLNEAATRSYDLNREYYRGVINVTSDLLNWMRDLKGAQEHSDAVETVVKISEAGYTKDQTKNNSGAD